MIQSSLRQLKNKLRNDLKKESTLEYFSFN
jgi:hypothetical protein